MDTKGDTKRHKMYEAYYYEIAHAIYKNTGIQRNNESDKEQ